MLSKGDLFYQIGGSPKSELSASLFLGITWQEFNSCQLNCQCLAEFTWKHMWRCQNTNISITTGLKGDTGGTDYYHRGYVLSPQEAGASFLSFLV